MEAKQGDGDSLGRLLGTYENYLKLLARTQLANEMHDVRATLTLQLVAFQQFDQRGDGRRFSHGLECEYQLLRIAAKRHFA